MSRHIRLTKRVSSRMGLVLLAYGLRSLATFAIAWPLSQRLAPVNLMAHLRADRELFAPGSKALLQILSEHGTHLAAFWHWGWLWGTAVVLAGALSAAVLLQALAHPPGTPAVVWLLRARMVLPTQLAITTLEWLAFAVIIALGKSVLPVVPAFVYPLFGELGADVALLLVALAVAALWLVAFTVAELAKATSVKWSASLRSSIHGACSSLVSRLRLSLSGALGYVATCTMVPLAIETLLPPTATASSLALALTAIIHQSIVIALCALHLFWWHVTLLVVRAPYQTQETDLDGSLD